MTRLGAFSVSKAFSVGALFLPALDSIAGAVDEGSISSSSLAISFFLDLSFSSSSSISG
jgi:hypothetical protein